MEASPALPASFPLQTLWNLRFKPCRNPLLQRTRKNELASSKRQSGHRGEAGQEVLSRDWAGCVRTLPLHGRNTPP